MGWDSSLTLCVLMPTHCTITRFGFRTRRIDGVECGLFSNHAPLGHTTLRLGRVSVGDLVAQAVSRSPPTAGVPSSGLGHSMWVSWWMKRGLGRFFSGFLPFSPTTNFISTISPHSSHPFRFISSALVMVRQAWSAGTLATHGPII